MTEDESNEPDSHGTVPSDALEQRPTQTSSPDGAVRTPKQIGHFHIKPVIASGGMGVVYLVLSLQEYRS